MRTSIPLPTTDPHLVLLEVVTSKDKESLSMNATPSTSFIPHDASTSVPTCLEEFIVSNLKPEISNMMCVWYDHIFYPFY